MTNKFLINYPFSNQNIQLVEGFSVYDGNLKDEINTPHKGIDYVRIVDGHHRSFDVFSMHHGCASKGLSKSWGRYVMVTAGVKNSLIYRTVYAHLRSFNPMIPLADDNELGRNIPAGFFLGKSGNTGWTKRIIQLHIELQTVNRDTKQVNKLDPYGLYDRHSSGKYPQPGQSLKALPHFWITDSPPLVK